MQKTVVVFEPANTHIRLIAAPEYESGFTAFGAAQASVQIPWVITSPTNEDTWAILLSQASRTPSSLSSFVEHRGSTYIVGEIASSPTSVRSVGAENKYNAQYLIPAFYAAMSKGVPQGKDADEPVPVELYFLFAPGTTSDMILGIGKILKGNHTAKVDGHTYRWKVSLNPKSAILETVGGMTYYALHTNSSAHSRRIVVVDAGGFKGAVISAQIDTSTVPMTITMGEISEINGGAITIAERLIPIVKSAYQTRFFSMEDALKAIIDNQAFINGVQTDISSEVDAAMSQYIAQIVVALNRLGINYYTPVFTGGTASAIYKRLQKQYFDGFGLKAELVCPGAPWLGNIRGAGLYVNSIHRRKV